MGPAVWRLLVICVAWSAGAALVWLAAAPVLDTVVPAIFAVAAFILTRGEGYGPRGGRGGPAKYWRGRRVDDDPRRRWN
jgi:hypothetical protein